ncbi:MAG: alpha-galactosidase [Planctomycetes bacterium]|nr:alpha-galactosidase [Planctomycetota bacterium]
MNHPDASNSAMHARLFGRSSRRQLLRKVATATALMAIEGCASQSNNDATAFPSPVLPREMALKDQWTAQKLLTASHVPPFSFIYDGKHSATSLRAWGRTQTQRRLDQHRTEHVITWNVTSLRVKCVAVEYNDYPVVEWTVYFKNTGVSPTPIIQNIQALDTHFSRGVGSEFVLNTIKGDFCTPDSYQPYQLELTPDRVEKFAPVGGKSSNGPRGWPYYNLQTPGGGIILAIGWPGQWASSFIRDNADGLHIQAGQELTHLYLKPGEEIRTPLIQLLFWRGYHVTDAQNLWRKFYIAHIIPRVDGKTPGALSQIQVNGNNVGYVKEFLRAGIKPDLCWRDQGGRNPWYVCSAHSQFPNNTGTWVINRKEFPDGFRPFTSWIHAHGMKFVLWCEPERVSDPGSWLATHHPQWLMRGNAATVGEILNEGDPQVLSWLIHHFDALIKDNGIDWYREDMNGAGPLVAWRNHDTADRQGITENFYVQGHLAYWDALLTNNPGLRIDSCASGGRRNDLETMRRAVPLLRSDFQWPGMPNVVNGNQCQTYGLSSWLPFQGTGVYYYDPYAYRSFYLPCFGMGKLTPGNTAAQRKAYSECKKIGPLMLFGDYYPLTHYSLDDRHWMAWQFNRPQHGDGCIQAFRRGKCVRRKMIFRLHGLDPSLRYTVTNFDIKGSEIMSGSHLMQRGLTVSIPDQPGSAIVSYRRV